MKRRLLKIRTQHTVDIDSASIYLALAYDFDPHDPPTSWAQTEEMIRRTLKAYGDQPDASHELDDYPTDEARAVLARWMVHA